MSRLLIHVEGQTEEAFVNATLAPHLYDNGYTNVGARLLGNARNRRNRGGIKQWGVVRRDIELHLKSDANAFATLMVDYYALPNSWPGRNDFPNGSVQQKFDALLMKVGNDFEEHTGIVGRFLPFVLMHEFEALLFSDCEAFANSLDCPEKKEHFQAIRDQFEDPEHINDSPLTAPSKRVVSLMPSYDKVLYGNVAANDIGLGTIRAQCPRFASWLDRLEHIAT